MRGGHLTQVQNIDAGGVCESFHAPMTSRNAGRKLSRITTAVGRSLLGNKSR